MWCVTQSTNIYRHANRNIIVLNGACRERQCLQTWGFNIILRYEAQVVTIFKTPIFRHVHIYLLIKICYDTQNVLFFNKLVRGNIIVLCEVGFVFENANIYSPVKESETLLSNMIQIGIWQWSQNCNIIRHYDVRHCKWMENRPCLFMTIYIVSDKMTKNIFSK